MMVKGGECGPARLEAGLILYLKIEYLQNEESGLEM